MYDSDVTVVPADNELVCILRLVGCIRSMHMSYIILCIAEAIYEYEFYDTRLVRMASILIHY